MDGATAFRVGWVGGEDGDDPRFWSPLWAALKFALGFPRGRLPSPERMVHEVFAGIFEDLPCRFDARTEVDWFCS
ncbi:hypothetical protein ACQPZ8_19340 [Actinomadura nitritigenes]|uniref:hypothetical protein n=1 Tax=Actinomadura nitritigenes TaxID=134602 RepID=UPI003D89CD50